MIALMTIPEINDVMNLWLKFMEEVYPAIDSSEHQESYKFIYETSNVYVAKNDESIIGFIAIVEGSYIDGWYVLPDFRNQGIGKSLIGHVMGKYDDLLVDIPQTQIQAINLVNSIGFNFEKEEINAEISELEKSYYWEK